jgi:hypothetical protein
MLDVSGKAQAVSNKREVATQHVSHGFAMYRLPAFVLSNERGALLIPVPPPWGQAVCADAVMLVIQHNTGRNLQTV